MQKPQQSPHIIDGEPFLTISQTVQFMGCTDGWVRELLRTGRLRGRKIGARLWMVSMASAAEAREALSTRANAKRHLAKRPAAARNPAKKAAKRKK